jgi:subtilisin family serine protease
MALFSLLFAKASAEPDYVEGEVLVLYKSSASVKALSAIPAASQSTQTRRTFSRLSQRAGRTVQFIKDSSQTTAELMASLQSNSTVEAVSPNYRKHIYAPTRIPDDPQFTNQWAFYNTGQTVNGTTGSEDADIDFTDARRLMMDSPPEAVIAIIDTGVDYNHSDLANAMWVNPGEIAGNEIDDDGNGYTNDVYGYDFAGDIYTDSTTEADTNDGADSDPMDINIDPGHGTHVAGIAAATSDNALGVAGTGSLKIMALKASADGESLTDSATLGAAEYVLEMKTNGVNIVAVNASYGGEGSNALERLAIQALGDAGIIFCAAAGNDGANNDSTPSYPASYNVSNVISVAATDASDGLAAFSNYGKTSVDIGAPGVNIYSCTPAHIGSTGQVISESQTFSAAGFTFSGLTDSNGISAVLVDCGIGYTNEFPAAVNGKIALIERGELYFTEKVANAMAAGAVAAVVYNQTNGTGEVSGTLMRPHQWIPTVGISRADGLTLLALSNQTVTVINCQSEPNSYDYLSGTSMATPIVTGAIGVLAQHFPSDTVTERIARLYSNADAVSALASVCSTGERLNLAKSLNSDADELPDWWELQYAADLTVMDDISDLDEDQSSDLDEYRTGTNPTQSTNRWTVLLNNPATSEDIIQLSWSSQTGCTYRVLATDNLVENSFEIIDENLSATPPLNEWTKSSTNLLSQFFKIEFIWE